MENIVKYCEIPEMKGKSFFFIHDHIVRTEQLELHQHAEWELSYVITGGGLRFVGDKVEPFSCGEIILLPPNIPHCWSFDEYNYDREGKIEYITIIFSAELFDKCSYVFLEMDDYVSQIKLYRQGIRFEGDSLLKLQAMMKGLLLQNNIEQLASLINLFFVVASSCETSIVGYCRNPNKGTEKMQEVYRFVFNNFHHRIALADVAKYVGMNRSSFCTFFKRMKGESFVSFLNKYRIDASCQMLRQTTIPIADICFATGFSDIPHYNRTFKELKGITPTQFRTQKDVIET